MAVLLLVGFALICLAGKAGVRFGRVAPLLLIFVAWVDVLTHEPNQNPTVPPNIYQTDLAREKLAMDPQPGLGDSRAMMSPMAFFNFVHSALSNPQNNFLIGRMAYGADANLLDGVPKVDGFFSLIPRECDDFQSILYGATNADYPALEDFMGVSQITAPDQIYHWQSRSHSMPLITAGQKPIFLNDAGTLQALQQSGFDPRQTVYLPMEEKGMVSVTNQTSATVLSSKFETQSVEAQVEAAGPSLVVISQTYYHDWQAFVDGVPTPLLRANDAFQAVQVPAGKHEVRLVYVDEAFRVGGAISICGWLVCDLLSPEYFSAAKINER